MTKHLADLRIEELELIICIECGINNLAEYACPTYLMDNEAICCECCECGECG